MVKKVEYVALIAFWLPLINLFAQPVSPELRIKMLARADSFSLHPPFKAPPGDALSHNTSGYAKIMCSAIFITGLKADFAAENVGYFTAPYPERAKVGKPVIDFEKKTVSIALPNGLVRTAIYMGDQGCFTLPEGSNALFFTPVKLTRNVPDAATTPWPMGDVVPDVRMPANLDMKKVQQAVDAAFSSADAQTAAFVVTYKGRIIAERYGEGITTNTALESWSMGKSLSATIMGTLIKKGIYTLEQPAPIPQWQGEGDGRKAIRIKDIMHMSSGLYCRASQDPDYDATNESYLDHKYLYTGSVNSFA
jgi:hypothetical protein